MIMAFTIFRNHSYVAKSNSRNSTAPLVVTEGNSAENVDIETLEDLRCEWQGCKQKFSSQKVLVDHVFTAHIQVCLSKLKWFIRLFFNVFFTISPPHFLFKNSRHIINANCNFIESQTTRFYYPFR